MTRHLSSLLTLLLFLLLASDVTAQQIADLDGRAVFSPSTRPVDGSHLALTSTNRAMTLDVDVRSFATAAGTSLRVDRMPVAPGLVVDLELEEWNIIRDGVQITIADVDGDRVITPTVKLYRGTVVGDPASDVFLSVSATEVLGHITTVDKSYELSTDPTGEVILGETIPVISYPTDALPNDAVACGVNDESLATLLGQDWVDYGHDDHDHKAEHPQTAEGIEFAAEGAWEADVEYLALFGSEQAAADYMVQLIANVSAVYERDLGVQLTIAHMKIWASANAEGYPYKERTVMGVALRETTTYWQGIPKDSINRDFAHAFSGKVWTNPIGIAWLSVLCERRDGAFSAITRTNTARDRRVVAHETGHNFGSNHTHHCGWNGPENGAIHRCAAAEGGRCFTQTQQTVGTIMSYCSQSELKFHPIVAERLKENLRNAACLTASKKLLVQPNLVIFHNSDKGIARDTVLETFFTNVGAFEAITVEDVEVTGDNVDQFEILEGAPPFTLEPGESKQIKVRFKAERLDGSTMSLRYTHDGLNPPVDVTFEGYASDARPILAFTNDDGKVVWSSRLIGSQNDSLLTGLYLNLGLDGSGPDQTADLYITDTRIEGPDKLDFQIVAGSAPMQIEALTRVDAVLRFAPNTPGTKQAWLVVESNSQGIEGTLDSFELGGEARVGPIMSFGQTDLTIDFGDVPLNGQSDRDYNGFFSNTGGEALNYFAGIRIPDGQPEDEFSSINVGIGYLEPGQANNLQATFKPATGSDLGIRKGFLIVISESEDGAVTLRTDTIYLVANVVAATDVPIELEPDERFHLLANPVTGGDLHYFLAPEEGEIGATYLMSLVDATGRAVWTRNDRFTSPDGEHRALSTGSLASGVYTLRVETNRGVRARRVVLQR